MTINTPSDIAAARDRACFAARDLVGAGYFNGPAARAKYEARIFRGEPAGAVDLEARTKSSCALTCEEIEREAGVDDDRLYAPIGPRLAGHGLPPVSLQRQIAKDHGAWVDTTHHAPGDPLPEPGDQLQQGGTGDGDPAWFRGRGFIHVFTVVEVHDDGTFDSVDGGEPDVELRHKRFVEACGELWVCAPTTPLAPDGRPTAGARIAGYLNLGALPFKADPSAPTLTDPATS
jgi:hypothetical protein